MWISAQRLAWAQGPWRDLVTAQSEARSGPRPPSTHSWQTASRCSSWVRRGKGREQRLLTPAEHRDSGLSSTWPSPDAFLTHHNEFASKALGQTLPLTYDKAHISKDCLQPPTSALSRKPVRRHQCSKPQSQVKWIKNCELVLYSLIHGQFLVSGQARALYEGRVDTLSGPYHLRWTDRLPSSQR